MTGRTGWFDAAPPPPPPPPLRQPRPPGPRPFAPLPEPGGPAAAVRHPPRPHPDDEAAALLVYQALTALGLSDLVGTRVVRGGFSGHGADRLNLGTIPREDAPAFADRVQRLLPPPPAPPPSAA